MYILKRILILLHLVAFPHRNFVKILFLYENPFIGQFVANDAFQKLHYQSQAGYLACENFVSKTLFDFLMKYT